MILQVTLPCRGRLSQFPSSRRECVMLSKHSHAISGYTDPLWDNCLTLNRHDIETQYNDKSMPHLVSEDKDSPATLGY